MKRFFPKCLLAGGLLVVALLPGCDLGGTLVQDGCGDGGCLSQVDCSADSQCDDGKVCTEDRCVDGECRHTAEADGLDCDDGNVCTVSDACQDGYCQGLARDCSALDGPCVQGVCSLVSEGCEAQALPDGAQCDDGLYCTGGDNCQAGECVGGFETSCDDEDPCTLDVCDPELDACLHEVDPDC